MLYQNTVLISVNFVLMFRDHITIVRIDTKFLEIISNNSKYNVYILIAKLVALKFLYMEKINELTKE